MGKFGLVLCAGRVESYEAHVRMLAALPPPDVIICADGGLERFDALRRLGAFGGRGATHAVGVTPAVGATPTVGATPAVGATHGSFALSDALPDALPDALVGDFDSADAALVREYEARGVPIELHPTQKDETDAELAFSRAASMGCGSILALGALGGRVDHTLANIHLLARAAKKGIRAAAADEHCALTVLSELAELSAATSTPATPAAPAISAVSAGSDRTPANGIGRINPTPANNGAGYVIIDAGHGGADPGSIGRGVLEKDAVLEVALRTAELLDEAGVDYILTRSADDSVSTERRIEIVNQETAAFVVSVHCDWYIDKDVRGASIQYDAGGGASKDLAVLLEPYVTAGLGAEDRSIHPHSDIALLREAAAPAVIVELAFISNDRDAALLKSEEFKSQAAQNLSGGICAALGLS
jgi:thiamine pyrophosphokinase